MSIFREQCTCCAWVRSAGSVARLFLPADGHDGALRDPVLAVEYCATRVIRRTGSFSRADTSMETEAVTSDFRRVNCYPLAMSKRDLYEVPGVSRSASQDEIRNAYKKLARKFHPDVIPAVPDAEKKFSEITEA